MRTGETIDLTAVGAETGTSGSMFDFVIAEVGSQSSSMCVCEIENNFVKESQANIWQGGLAVRA